MDTLRRRRRALVPLVVFALAALVAACAPPVPNNQSTSSIRAIQGSNTNFTVTFDSAHVKKIGQDSQRAYFGFAGTAIVRGTADNDLQRITFVVVGGDQGFSWTDLKTSGYKSAQDCSGSSVGFNVSIAGYGGSLSVPKTVCSGETANPSPNSWPTVVWAAGDGGVDTPRQIPMAFAFSVPLATATTTWRPNLAVIVQVQTSVCGMWGCNSQQTNSWGQNIYPSDWSDWM